MGIVNKRVFIKSYMLEILKNGVSQEVFTFSMPPKSEDFDFGQRVIETKTFGGSVIDKYGSDTVKITLSGSTGNGDNKIIYRGLHFFPKYLNGEKEIFWLQKRLNDFHKQDKLTEGIDIYLYDLSKMNVVELATLRPSKNWWKVFIKNFKIKRDDSKPNTFNYTLEMIGIDDEPKSSLLEGFDKVQDFVDGFNKAMEITQSVMEYTEGAFALLEETSNVISRFAKGVEEFSNMSAKGIVLRTFKDMDSFSRLLTGTNNNTLYNSAKSCLSVANQWTKLCTGESIQEKQNAKIQNSSSFVIMFNTNGGSVVPRQSVEYSNKIVKPENPTRNEYSFDCWCSDSELQNEYDFSQEVTSAMTLYARWKIAVATVTFNTNFGTPIRPIKVNVGEKLVLPENPTKNGFVFERWCLDSTTTQPFDVETPITENITLYAKWKDVCVVTFDTDGGSVIESQNVNIGGLVVYPMTPTKENYTFSHWCIDAEKTETFDFSTPINTNITLYAVFIQTTNTVTFNSNGGGPVEKQRVPIGGHATKPANPERQGFDFVCWCTDVDCTNEFLFNTVEVNSSITLYAKWTVKQLTVTFDTVGGSTLNPQSVSYNTKVVFPEIPTKSGKVFEMWQTRSEEKTLHTGVFENVVVYEDDGVTPKLDENEEEITECVEVMDYEYTEFDFDTKITEDLTLYAKWFGGN